jgi:hypothetical protein
MWDGGGEGAGVARGCDLPLFQTRYAEGSCCDIHGQAAGASGGSRQACDEHVCDERSKRDAFLLDVAAIGSMMKRMSQIMLGGVMHVLGCESGSALQPIATPLATADFTTTFRYKCSNHWWSEHPLTWSGAMSFLIANIYN